MQKQLQQDAGMGTKKAVRILGVFALLALAGGWAVYALAVYLAGGSLAGLILLPLVFVVLALLPGLLLVEWCMPKLKGTAVLPIGAVTGCFILVCGYAVFGSLGLVWLSALPSAIAAVVWVIKNHGRFKNLSVNTLRNAFNGVPYGLWLLLIIFAVLIFIYSFTGVLAYSRPSDAGYMLYNHDLLWSVGNAAAVPYGFPLQDLRAAGGILHYHFFAEAVAGLLGMYAGQSAWDTVCFLSWPIWVGLLLLSLWSAARRMGAGQLLALMAPLGATLLLGTYAPSILHVFWNMNNLIQGYLFLITCFLVLQANEKEGFANTKGLLLAVTTAGALMWTKSTIGILYLLAMLVSWPIYTGFQKKKMEKCYPQNKQRRKAQLWPLFALLCGGVILGVLYFGLFSKATNHLLFSPGRGFKETFTVMTRQYWPAAFLYLITLPVSIWLFPKFSFTDFVINAMIVGGFLGVGLFDHYAGSEQYFLLASSFLMWLAITRSLPVLLQKKWVGALPVTLCLVMFAGEVKYLAPTVYDGAVVGQRVLGLRPQAERIEESVSPDDEAAALWLGENLSRDEVFATNRNAKMVSVGDGVFHYYTAVSERQAYVESWQYAHDYSMPNGQVRINLIEVSEVIYLMEDFDEAAEMARQNDIDYLVLYLPLRREPFKGAEPVFTSDDVLIYKVP